MDANASDVLSTLLLDAQQTVTPKLLASRLSLPLPACRALLAAFADAHRELAATFVLTGPADGQLKVTLVPADKLAEAKKAFEQCTAHIHSLSPAPLRDPESLFLVDAPLLRNPDFDHAGLWPVRNIKCVKSTVKRAPPSSVSAPPRPVAKPVEKKEEKKEEPKEKEKKGIAGFFGKQTAKESKQEAPKWVGERDQGTALGGFKRTGQRSEFLGSALMCWSSL